MAPSGRALRRRRSGSHERLDFLATRVERVPVAAGALDRHVRADGALDVAFLRLGPAAGSAAIAVLDRRRFARLLPLGVRGRVVRRRAGSGDIRVPAGAAARCRAGLRGQARFCPAGGNDHVRPVVVVGVFLGGRTLHPPQGFSPLAVLIALGFFGLEMFLWATLFSLLSKRVLVAAILGVVAASLGVQILVELIYPGHPDAATWRYWAVMPERMAVAAVLALVDFWLGARWFRQRSDRRLRSAAPPDRVGAGSQSGQLSERFQAPERLTILGRLVWLHWRQSAWLLAAVGALLVPWAMLGIVWLIRMLADESWLQPTPESRVAAMFAVTMGLASIPLLGLSAFLPDQWGRSYRFLADRGVPPKYVWLSRQLTTVLAPLLLLAAIFVVAILLAALLGLTLFPNDPREWERVSAAVFCLGYTILSVFGYAVVCLAVGQFCSMLFRSGVLAAFFSVLLASLLAAWCGLMLFWGVNWLWSALPIPVALLAATRLRTRDWLLERNTWRTWLWPILVLGVPAVAILTAVPLYRIHEMPDVDPGFSPDKYARPVTPEEQATMDLYRQAVEALHPRWPPAELEQLYYNSDTRALTKEEIAQIDANQKAMALALRASRGSFFQLIDKNSNWELHDIQCLPRWLILGAIKLADEGKLDAALEHLLAAMRVMCPSSLVRFGAFLVRRQAGDDNLPSVDFVGGASPADRRANPAPPAANGTKRFRDLRSPTRSRSNISTCAAFFRAIWRQPFGIVMAGWRRCRRRAVMLWLQLPWERAAGPATVEPSDRSGTCPGTAAQARR